MSPELVDLLSRSSLFRGLPSADLAALGDIGRLRPMAKGEVLFLAGDPADAFFLVVTGRVKLAQTSPAGREQILHVHGPAETFAEGTLPEGSRYPATAIATEEGAVLRFPVEAFRGLLGRRPGIAANLVARLSQRLREMAALVEDLSLREVPARLARHLLELAGGAPADGTVVRLPGTKGDLASRLGTRPETLSRALRRLSDAGLIDVDGGQLRLLDPDMLRDLAEGCSDGI